MYPTINHSFLSLFLLLLPGIQPFPYLPLMSPHHARVHPPDTRERAASPCINLPSRNRNDASHPSSPPPPLTPFACKNIERNSSTNGSRSSSQFHHLEKWRNLISGPLSRIEHLRTYANQPGVYICVRVCVCVCTCEVAEDRTPISSLARIKGSFHVSSDKLQRHYCQFVYTRADNRRRREISRACAWRYPSKWDLIKRCSNDR